MERTKIYILGDPHLGITYPWRVGKYGISDRTNDHLQHFQNVCDDIIDAKDCIVVIIAGDFFHRVSINHTVEQYIHKQIFTKLRKAHIGVIILGGNHDTYSDPNQGCMLDNFDHNQEQNCIVIRDFCAVNTLLGDPMKRIGTIKQSKINAWWKKHIIPTLAKYEVGLVLFPYLSPIGILDHCVKPSLKAEFHKVVEKEWGLSFAQKKIADYVAHEFLPFIDRCSNRLMIGHYRLDGSKIAAYLPPSTYTNEITFTKEMIKPDAFNLVAFGHIHIPQTLWGLPHVLHTGSIDHTNWGEWEDRKSYVVYDLSTKTFGTVSLEYDERAPERAACRPLYDMQIRIPLEVTDPNGYIVERIKDNTHFENAMVRANVVLSYAAYKLIKDRWIEAQVRDFTYHVDMRFERVAEDPEKVIDRSTAHAVLDPMQLLTEYLQKYSADPDFTDIKDISTTILKKALQEDEIK